MHPAQGTRPRKIVFVAVRKASHRYIFVGFLIDRSTVFPGSEFTVFMTGQIPDEWLSSICFLWTRTKFMIEEGHLFWKKEISPSCQAIAGNVWELFGLGRRTDVDDQFSAGGCLSGVLRRGPTYGCGAG